MLQMESIVPAIKPITPSLFAAFATLIHRESGIHLTTAKQALLTGRLQRRLRALGLDNFRDYLRIAESDLQERREMINAITTHETQFFREPSHFDLLRSRTIPAMIAEAAAGLRARRIRVWSAGCSTGEEPYSLAMLLADLIPDWSIDILATDLSTRVLDLAREGSFPIKRKDAIPTDYLKRFMLRGIRSREGTMRAGDEIRALIGFRYLNLNDERYAGLGTFDLIFCRNVLIYFDASSKRRVVSRLLDHLDPAGLLFLGHAESLNGLTDRARCVRPTVYARRDATESKKEISNAQ